MAITNDQPYVQENVLLRLRVVSDQNLERADPELPSTNDFLLQKIAGPDTSTRKDAKGNREIVNDFTLTLTPLRSGDLELPPIKVSGTQAGSGQGGYPGPSTRYEVASERSQVQVRPVLTSVSPWLPLHDLNLTANLDSARDVAEGEPVTISLELKAVGTTGSQLPSLEGMLASPDFRVYREQTLTEGGLSADKRSLVGKRTEYYTLVPHSGGRLRMPAIQIAWWNVDKGTREVAGLPIHTLKVEGESGPFGLSRYADTGHSEGWGLLWIPSGGADAVGPRLLGRGLVPAPRRRRQGAPGGRGRRPAGLRRRRDPEDRTDPHLGRPHAAGLPGSGAGSTRWRPSGWRGGTCSRPCPPQPGYGSVSGPPTVRPTQRPGVSSSRTTPAAT